MFKKAAFLVLAVALAVSFTGGAALAAWPERPITVVVHFAAGGATDMVARALSAEMQKVLGQPISVVNMPGASGAVATAFVLAKPHDGYTLVGESDNIRMFQVMDLGNFNYKDFHHWIGAMGTLCISVRPDSPIKDGHDLIKFLKEKGASATVSGSGLGTGWHVGMEMLKAVVGLDYKYVPYSGGHPATVAAIGGEVDIAATGLMEQAEFIRGKKVRPLMNFSDEPVELPGYGPIPPVTDFVPEMKGLVPFGGWWGIAAPKGVPDEVLQKLDEAYKVAVNSEGFKKLCESQVMDWVGYDRAQSEELAAKDTSLVSWILWEVGVAKKNPADLGIPKPEGLSLGK
jgi:tripartite-type tricarboxylate transporter receptor subunit TctC